MVMSSSMLYAVQMCLNCYEDVFNYNCIKNVYTAKTLFNLLYNYTTFSQCLSTFIYCSFEKNFEY